MLSVIPIRIRTLATFKYRLITRARIDWGNPFDSSLAMQLEDPSKESCIETLRDVLFTTCSFSSSLDELIHSSWVSILPSSNDKVDLSPEKSLHRTIPTAHNLSQTVPVAASSPTELIIQTFSTVSCWLSHLLARMNTRSGTILLSGMGLTRPSALPSRLQWD